MKKKDLMLLLESFKHEYNRLYDAVTPVEGYAEAVNTFDKLIYTDSFKAIVTAFNAVRCDFISSNREAAAFIFACQALNII